MILPILEYCPYSTFGNLSKTLEEKILRTDNRAHKIIGKSPSASMKTFQRKRVTAFVHRCITKHICENFENYFELIETKINTRNNGTLIRLPKVKLEVARKSFFFQGGLEYSMLPREIRSEMDHEKFKAKIKKYLRLIYLVGFDFSDSLIIL